MTTIRGAAALADELTKLPLYQVQALSVEQPLALQEAARRYALTKAPNAGDAYRLRVATAFRRGFHEGNPNPYEAGRGGNFAATLRHAWTDGYALYLDISTDR